MKTKRFFASLLALVLLLSCVNLTALAADNNPNTDGLILKKTPEKQDDGSYKIRLEAYTTGEVTTTSGYEPVDIVLVLDQSGSMADGFGSTTRQAAMKNAVKGFIQSVHERYDKDNADHRIAIVKFESKASTLQNWTAVDANGKSTLDGKINTLPSSPSGATNAGAGMTQAESLMGSGYSYNGSNTKRQKVVVFFTDGIPTTTNEFDTGVADTAISAAKRMKDNGVTVYSIGIFNGVNNNEMYGASGFDINSDGTIGSKWIMDKWGLLPGTDFPEADRPAGNRFLNLLSSNYMDATVVGLKRQTDGFGILHHKITYIITQNFTRNNDNYYLTTNNAAGLSQIFQEIVNNFQVADIDLDSTTVVKDIVSPYFNVPANSNDIKLYTAAAKADGTFENAVPATGLTTNIVGDSISVTGFDFNDNFVSDKPKADGTYGKKLIIEFTVTPKDGFLGGNGVPTNGADSGVYTGDGSAVKKFDVPTVDVPIPDFTVTAEDKNVYLMGELKDEDFAGGVKAMYGNVNLLDTNAFTGENAWKADFVEIQTAITKPQANELTEDKTYSAAVTVKPKEQGTIQDKVVTGSGNINVFKPELTFKDFDGYYGADVPAFTGNPTTKVWKHEQTVSADVTMIGDEPTLDITCTPEASMLDGNKINTKQDISVKAKVKIGTADVTTHTNFVHQDCTSNCNWTTPANPGNPAFLIHVKTCTLNVTKTGGADGESYVFNVFKDGTKYTEVTIEGNDTQTIVELPVGTYTIQEDTGWSWRYPNPNYSDSVALSATAHEGTITCNNTSNNNKWLNGFSGVVRNIFATAIIS